MKREGMIKHLISNMANTIHQEMTEEGVSDTLYNIMSAGYKTVSDKEVEDEYFDTFES